MPPPIDLTGRTFGRLAVLRRVGRTDAYGGCRTPHVPHCVGSYSTAREGT